MSTVSVTDLAKNAQQRGRVDLAYAIFPFILNAGPQGVSQRELRKGCCAYRRAARQDQISELNWLLAQKLIVQMPPAPGDRSPIFAATHPLPPPRKSMPDLTLTPAQQVAYDTLLPVLQRQSKTETAVLEGYAGTGKSFLVAQLLKALADDLPIAVAAPTNKAVRVLKSMLEAAGVPVAAAGEDDAFGKPRIQRKPGMGCTCKSIHAFLGLKMKEMDNGQQQASKESESTVRQFAVLVVDEASMLDSDLFNRVLLERGECRVLFVGDPAQLPPVNGRGALSPVFDRIALKVRLAEVIRQAAENPIIRLSMRIRALIEADIKADPLTLLQALPAVETGPKAALMAGTPDDLVSLFLAEYRHDANQDTRIIAYTNARVMDYNRRIHRALHGDTGALAFVRGDPVIVHSQGEGRRLIGVVEVADCWEDDPDAIYETERLITSEELTVLDARVKSHPLYPDFPANQVVLKSASGAVYEAYVPASQAQLDQQIDSLFGAWRTIKLQAQLASGAEHERMKEKAADASGKGWAMRKAFLNLRHSYALTSHKAQGSSFDCALVDFSDLNRMPDAFEFNRCLYVAVTRSREFLALVVT